MKKQFTIRNEGMRIAGKTVFSENEISVLYPFTEEIVGSVPAATVENVQKAFSIAANYKSKLSRYERQQILFKIAEIIKKRKDELAPIITSELGISINDSLYEIGRAYDVYTLAGQLCIQDDGEIFSCDLTPHGKARKIFTIREPLRSISAITPFNHPLNMISHKIAPAIATNNCIVAKPTELTPLTAIYLADIIYEAGLPPEMLSVVTGLPEEIGNEIITNPNIELITFTGGIPVGKIIANKAGYKRQVLELGGNDPLIVLNDLTEDDLDKAAELAVSGATKNSGQRCTAVKRILVQNKVADKLVPIILEKAKQIKFGDPMNNKTDLGTVISSNAAEIFENRLIKSAENGASILYHPERKGALLPPIVVDNVDYKSELVVEETFGTIIPIVRVPDNDDETIKISNSTNYGLSAGVCSNNFFRIQKYISGLDVGTVNIWEVPGYRIEMSPFGGIKDSGNGIKEGVQEAMKCFTNVKTFSLPWTN